MFEATLFQNRPQYVVHRMGLDFMANVPGLIITLRLTWVDVGRKRQEGNINAINPNSPIPSIPHSLHAVPTFLSFPQCRTHCILAHLTQRWISRQSPHSCQNTLVAINFQLGRKLIGPCLHLLRIPWGRTSDFPWEQALCPASHIRLLRYNLHTTQSVTLYKLQHYNAESQREIWSIFRCAEPVRGLLLKKKKKTKTLQFFESRKCVRGRKVHIINVFHYN